MSNISNRHQVVPFVSGKTMALNGQRLAKIGYKPRGKNEAKYKSVAVSVPVVKEPLEDQDIARLMPYIKSMIESAQDGIIRSLYKSSDGTLGTVSDEDISLNSVIGFLESENSGGRLTKEYLQSWFDSNMADNLYVVIAEKLGFNDPSEAQEPQIYKSVKIYKDLISSLSGGATLLSKVQIIGLRRALEVSSVDDDTAKKLVNRLDKMEKPVEVAELLDL